MGARGLRKYLFVHGRGEDLVHICKLGNRHILKLDVSVGPWVGKYYGHSESRFGLHPYSQNGHGDLIMWCSCT